MTICDKKNKKIILVEETVCNVGQISDRNEYKKNTVPGHTTRTTQALP